MRVVHRRELGACVGAPGPYDLTVRERCRSSIGISASTAARLAFVTTRTPLVSKRDAWQQSMISEKTKEKYF
jgi:hypothetical protein